MFIIQMSWIGSAETALIKEAMTTILPMGLARILKILKALQSYR